MPDKAGIGKKKKLVRVGKTFSRRAFTSVVDRKSPPEYEKGKGTDPGDKCSADGEGRRSVLQSIPSSKLFRSRSVSQDQHQVNHSISKKRLRKEALLSKRRTLFLCPLLAKGIGREKEIGRRKKCSRRQRDLAYSLSNSMGFSL